MRTECHYRTPPIGSTTASSERDVVALATNNSKSRSRARPPRALWPRPSRVSVPRAVSVVRPLRTSSACLERSLSHLRFSSTIIETLSTFAVVNHLPGGGPMRQERVVAVVVVPFAVLCAVGWGSSSASSREIPPKTTSLATSGTIVEPTTRQRQVSTDRRRRRGENSSAFDGRPTSRGTPWPGNGR